MCSRLRPSMPSVTIVVVGWASRRRPEGESSPGSPHVHEEFVRPCHLGLSGCRLPLYVRGCELADEPDEAASGVSPTAVVRHVDCEGAFNLRDLGGYRAGDGRTLRWRTVFRADGLHRIPAEVRPTLDRLRWRTVIDLRTLAEVDDGGYSRPGIEVVHLPVLRSTWDAADLAAESGDPSDPAEVLAERYVEMSEQGSSAIAAAFELLASASRLPVVFHCSAGKDRTGVLAALILAALGVDEAQIAEDYSLSEVAMGRLIAWITVHRPELAEDLVDQPTAFLACPPEAIVGFLDRLRARHGSVHWYLADIGVDRATVEALCEALLED